MDPYWQYQIPLWMLVVLFPLVLLIALEVGFRLGNRSRDTTPNIGERAGGDVTLTAMLALLGLMLAFTYSFSLSRADLRKVAVIDEVNAIGTAFLRADLLSEPGRSEVRQRLFDYAKSRHVEPGTVKTRKELQAVVDRTVLLQSKIWPSVKLALRHSSEMSAPEKALLISATNDVLDAHTKKLAVILDRLPTAVLGLLLLIASASLAMAGYNSALRRRGDRWRLTSFAMVLAGLMYVILDYDMMMRGLIQVDQQSMVLLIDDMGKAISASQ